MLQLQQACGIRPHEDDQIGKAGQTKGCRFQGRPVLQPEVPRILAGQSKHGERRPVALLEVHKPCKQCSRFRSVKVAWALKSNSMTVHTMFTGKLQAL